MGKRSRQRDELWAHAKRVCRLNARQIEMAKKLGLSPKKLPSLVPSKSQPWKAPVGVFIEELYAKRLAREAHADAPATARAVNSGQHGHETSPALPDRCRHQVESLVCYFANLSDDLGRLLASRRLAPEHLDWLREELTSLIRKIEAGRPLPQFPETYFGDSDEDKVFPADASTTSDDEIPF